MPDVEEADSFSVYRGECLFLHKAESVPLLYAFSIERMPYSFSVQRRVCVPHQEEGVSSRYKGESFPIPDVEEADSFSVQRRECLLSTKDTPSGKIHRKSLPRKPQNRNRY